ncbi:MAG: S4 domain-containing protein, partial [Gammaproteobacteria bacterium]|nr:S4 domain-containing protein [Gammaproteobacteria bacterium]
MTDTLVRISKLLASRGVCSRREADHYLEQGLVEVDGHRAVLGERAAPDARITEAFGEDRKQGRERLLRKIRRDLHRNRDVPP